MLSIASQQNSTFIQTNPGYYNGSEWVAAPFETTSESAYAYYQLLVRYQYNGTKTRLVDGILPVNELGLTRTSFERKYATLATKSFHPLGPTFVTVAEIPGNFQYLEDPELSVPFDVAVETVLNAAKQKALDKASDVQGNLSITLAEANETLKTIRDFVKRTSAAIVQVKRRNFAHAWRILVPNKVLPPRRPDGKKWGYDNSWINDWLGMRYGWTPLIADAQNLAMMAAQRIASRPKTYTVSGAAHYLGPGVGPGPFKYPVVYDKRYTTRYVPTSGLVMRSRRTLYGSIVCRASLTVRVTSQAAQDLNQILGNPLSVLWEKVPLSFIVDRYVAIGDYLRNLSALAGLQVIKGWTSVEVERNVADSVVSSADYDVTTSLPGYFRSTDYDRRGWNGSVPLSSGNVAINGHTVKQYVDEVALLAQRLVGGRTPRDIN